MTAVKQSANDTVSFVNAAVAGDFRDRKTITSLKVFKEIETDQESNASSSEDMEYYSPKSVVAKSKKWPVTARDIDVSGGRVHSQILRIRAEDLQIGEDIGECLISKFSVAGNDHVNVMIFSRPASPLSGKALASIKSVH